MKKTNMFEVDSEKIKPGIIKYRIKINGNVLTFKEWINYLKDSNEFISFYIEILRESSYEGFFWEVKPMNSNRLNEAFEFVLVNSRTLPNITADTSSFKEHFKEEKDVLSFPNLGGDAQLIVPNQISNSSNYTHLARFVRNAPLNQVVNFWRKVGEEYERLIGNETKWLSTAGLGVYWLHVRIDSRPKYYRFNDYRTLL